MLGRVRRTGTHTGPVPRRVESGATPITPPDDPHPEGATAKAQRSQAAQEAAVAPDQAAARGAFGQTTAEPQPEPEAGNRAQRRAQDKRNR